jgi:DNA-binding LacI/PurR family transcriptional regulator
VLGVIRELDYRPSQAARALSRGKSRSLTVLTSDTTLYGRAATLRGIEEAARTAGYSVGICVIESEQAAAIRTAMDRSCDPTSAGVIVIAYDLAGVRALRAVPPGIPVAAALEVTDSDDAQRFASVTLDDRTAASAATRYLLDLGHHTVHYVSAPNSTGRSGRTEGWRSALQSAGAHLPDPVQVGWSPESGYRAGRALAANPEVTAVLCANDDLALGVMHAMHEAGRAIPGSVSIVGFDDTPQSAHFCPPLTTVRLDFPGLGRECFHLLTGEGSAIASQPELIVRGSTGPARR